MTEEISVRFANAKKEYLKTLTPVTFTASISEAYKVSCDVTKIDYDWIKNEVLNVIEKIYMNDGIQTLILWIFDSLDNDFCNTTIVHDPAGRIFGTDSWDPTAKVTDDMHDAADLILNNIKAEIGDIFIRCISSTKTISSTISSMAKDVGATIPGAGKACTTDLDKLCDSISQNTKAEIVKPKETLADYICNDLLKTELEEIKDFFEHSGTYKSAGVSIPKGILFKGPWGTGKTYAARCIAGSVDCYFMTCTASALQGQYIGSGAENIRNIFKGAKLLAEKSGKGVILFIDELDSFGDRANRSGGAGGEEDRTLNQLLAEMSGFTETENIMVLAATNFPERLDSALMRSGRFGRQITIDYPDDEERKYMVKYYFDKIKMDIETGVSHEDIAALTKGLTPADIKEISNEAGILTIRQSKTVITLDNINEAINKVITKNIRHPDKSSEELELVTAHECGHVVAEVLYNNTIPIKVTNYAYGDAGGFTQSAEVLSGILPKERFIAEVKMLLGGRAAEEVICGYITNGASNDLEKAKNILSSYFKYYNFEKYEVKELDQLVINMIDELYHQVIEDFNKPENCKVLKNLISELTHKRVLYNSNIVGIVSPIRKVVF
jgi:ATP-dependent Zn protease